MSDTESARLAFDGAGDLAGDDDRPEVEACIFCQSADLALAFDHPMVVGQRVAVPAWVGLCGDCICDVQSQSFGSIVVRARGTTWDDFDADDLIQVASAMTGAVGPYRRRRSN
jgi:hypothetical protein